jgi:hypothetical protein
MTNSMGMEWAGHVASMWGIEMHVEFWCESQKERDHCEDIDIGGKIILK